VPARFVGVDLFCDSRQFGNCVGRQARGHDGIATIPGALISQRRADRLVSETRHVLSQSRYLGVLRPGRTVGGQIAEGIGASRASLTANIRQLTAAGFVRRQSRPGECTAYFWIDDDAWERVLHNRFASMAAFKNIARDGMELAGPRSAQAARMQSAYDAFDWLTRLVDASPKPPEPKRSNS
jgi:hypothetical protein